MAFHSGRVSFCRFRVVGDAPASVDEALLSILQEHAFRETAIGAPEQVEAGWITGEHLLDTQFSYEKNGFGNLAMFALRIDTHQVPAAIKQAYRKINEQAAAAGNPSGFASRAQKREAQELAGRQIHEDLAAGKFRKSKAVPLIWDLPRQTLYCGATGNTVVEQLARLFRQSFGAELEAVTAGTLAGELLKEQGRRRDWEDLHPSPFTAPPPEAHAQGDDADGPRDVAIPTAPWCARSVDLKDFLGNEFLIWLWWRAEAHEGEVPVRTPAGGQGQVFVTLDKALDMDCAWGVRGRQSLRGDGPTRWNEAAEALAMGKWPRRAGLILSDGEHQWELTLQGDRMQVSGAALPEVPDAQSPRQLLEGRLLLIGTLASTLDAAYQSFLAQRCSGGWSAQRQAIRQWIADRRRPTKRPLTAALATMRPAQTSAESEPEPDAPQPDAAELPTA
ncbi:MAG TPA: hypothetical protein VF184_10600 [Phycisphaeraceae bacterium]